MFRGSICLCPDVLWGVFDHRPSSMSQMAVWGVVVCGVCFGDEKGFHVGINIKLP
jgi:hypothetical protein